MKFNLSNYGKIRSGLDYLLDENKNVIQMSYFDTNIDTNLLTGPISILCIKMEDSKYSNHIEFYTKDKPYISKSVEFYSTIIYSHLSDFVEYVERVVNNVSHLDLNTMIFSYDNSKSKDENDFDFIHKYADSELVIKCDKGSKIILNGDSKFTQVNGDYVSSIYHMINNCLYRKDVESKIGEKSNIESSGLVHFRGSNKGFRVELSNISNVLVQEFEEVKNLHYRPNHVEILNNEYPQYIDIEYNNFIASKDSYNLTYSEICEDEFDNKEYKDILSLHRNYNDMFSLYVDPNQYCIEELEETDEESFYSKVVYDIDRDKLEDLENKIKELNSEEQTTLVLPKIAISYSEALELALGE